ncbi:MAG: VTT domain-containing protein [Ruminococcus sp.]|nr:VTT domain-containing protein [Ruminococcus sp.]
MGSNDIRTKNEKLKLITRGIILGIMIVLMVVATIALIPVISILKTDEGSEKLLSFIEARGVLAPVIFMGLQALQVIIPLIPPIQIVGGILFGPIMGSIYSCIGIYVGMSIVFCIVRIFGYPIVEALISGKDLKKFKFLADSSKVEIIFFILYFIPGMPKDTLSFVAPLTSVRPKHYFMYVLPARFPLMILAAVFGSAVRSQSYTFAVILCIIMIDLAIIGVLFRDKILSAIQKQKPEENIAKSKKAINSMYKTGIGMNFASAVLLCVLLVLSSTDTFSLGRKGFLADGSFSSFENVFYFLVNYGEYFMASLILVGTVSVTSAYIRNRNLARRLSAASDDVKAPEK